MHCELCWAPEQIPHGSLAPSHLCLTLTSAHCHQGIPLGEVLGGDLVCLLLPPSVPSHIVLLSLTAACHRHPGSHRSRTVWKSRGQASYALRAKDSFPPGPTTHLQLIDKADKCQKMDGPVDKCGARWAASIRPVCLWGRHSQVVGLACCSSVISLRQIP